MSISPRVTGVSASVVARPSSRPISALSVARLAIRRYVWRRGVRTRASRLCPSRELAPTAEREYARAACRSASAAERRSLAWAPRCWLAPSANRPRSNWSWALVSPVAPVSFSVSLRWARSNPMYTDTEPA